MRADGATARGRFLEATRASDSSHPALILQMILTSLGAVSLPVGSGGDTPLAAVCDLAGAGAAPAPAAKPLDVSRFRAYWEEVFRLAAWPAEAWTEEDRSRCRSEYALLEEAVLEVAGPLAHAMLRKSLGVAWYEVVRGILQANAFRTATTLPRPTASTDGDGESASTDSDGESASTDSDGESASTDSDGESASTDGDGESAAARLAESQLVESQQAVVLFPVDLSLLNHSCEPNCGVSLVAHPESGPLALLGTKRPVAAGEEATISYLAEGGSLGQSAQQGESRFEQLRLGFGFECECGGTCIHDA